MTFGFQRCGKTPKIKCMQNILKSIFTSYVHMKSFRFYGDFIDPEYRSDLRIVTPAASAWTIVRSQSVRLLIVSDSFQSPHCF